MFDRARAFGREFFVRFWNVRLLVLALIWVVALDICLEDFRGAARTIGGRGNFAILPFIQNDGYFEKVMLSGVVCFYSNAPFMDRHALYQVQRVGKRRFGASNIVYLFASGAALSILLFVLSIALSGGCIAFSNEWGSLYRSLANGVYETPGISVSSAILQKYSPLSLLAVTFGIDTLAFTAVGMLIYTVSLYTSRDIGCFLALVAVFITTLDEYYNIYLFSPLSWLKYRTWRRFYEPGHPDLAYMLAMYLLILLIGAYFSQWRLSKMDWKNYEEG